LPSSGEAIRQDSRRQDNVYDFPLPCDPQMNADQGVLTFRKILGSGFEIAELSLPAVAAPFPEKRNGEALEADEEYVVEENAKYGLGENPGEIFEEAFVDKSIISPSGNSSSDKMPAMRLCAGKAPTTDSASKAALTELENRGVVLIS